MLALGKALVNSIGNLRFGPEVGVGTIREDAPVLRLWQEEVATMADDLDLVKASANVSSVVHRADARQMIDLLEPQSIDAVITSPPYPNEKDYTRTTRLELVLLGFVKNKAELQSLKKKLVRSNTRSVYKEDDDDQWIAGNERIREIADRIEKRRIELGKTSGFERLYARVTKLYFGGMFRHLRDMRTVLKPGARLAYVVGDQASYLQVMIRTGEILGDIAHSLGYEVTGIDLFRTRLATATREQLREEVVVLRWPG
jgi:DNA modification methylase